MSLGEFKIAVPSSRRDHGREGRPKARKMQNTKQDQHDDSNGVKPYFLLDLEWESGYIWS
jgi:hypothetical protein